MFSGLLIFYVLSATNCLALSDNDETDPPPQEVKNYGYNFHEENNISPILATQTTQLLGDRIDTSSGSISIEHIDIDIPGNSEIPVRIVRKLSDPDSWYRETRDFENWSLGIPHVRSTYVTDREGNYFSAYWANGKACTSRLNTNPTFTRSIEGHSYTGAKESYWNGDTVYIPGKGSVKLTEKEGDQTYKRYNNRNWKVECLLENNNYEGFKITDDNGFTYYFNQQRIIKSIKPFNLSPNIGNFQCGSISNPCPVQSVGPASDPVIAARYYQYFIFMLATRVEDRFGNWVEYKYDTSSNLTEISSNDSRTITLSYLDNRISAISAMGKTWNYDYEDTYVNTLRTVKRPDNKQWTFTHDKSSSNSLWRFQNIAEHSQAPTHSQLDCISSGVRDFIEISHPEGLTGKFELIESCQGQSNVSKILKPNPNRWTYDSYWQSKSSAIFAINQKSLTMTDGSFYEWNYQYSANKGHYKGDSFTDKERFPFSINSEETGHLKFTSVIRPDNSKVINYYDRRFGDSFGNLLYKEVYDKTGTLMQRDKMSYANGTYHGSAKLTSYIAYSEDNWTLEDITKGHSASQKQNLKSKEISLFLVNGSDVYTTEYERYDVFDLPLATFESNNFSSDKRYREFSYYNDTNNGVIGLPDTNKISSTGGANDFIELNRTTYNDLSQPYQYYSFGNLSKINSSYHANGKLKRLDFNDSNRYEIYENYKRGKPQKITLPCSQLNTCSTANGSSANTIIALVTVNDDGTVNDTTDFKGSKTSYEYNSVGWLTKINPEDVNWSDTDISYETITSDDISGSNVAAGSLKQTITSGAYEKRNYYDNYNRIFLTRERDNNDTNSTRFQRFQYDYSNRKLFESFFSQGVGASEGHRYSFDAIGRQLTNSRTSDNATSSYSYIKGNKSQSYDPLNNTTTTTYLAYGSPSSKYAKSISSSGLVSTSINYNLLNQVELITQGGVTERRVYDENFRLCKFIRPETGNITYEYNGQRQLLWKATNVDTSSLCNRSNIPSNKKENYVYNNLGILAEEKLIEGSSRLYSYDENSNVTSLRYQGSNWQYGYDSHGNLTYERLDLDNKSFRFDYLYTNLGHLSQVTYNSNRQVLYAPNALGQPSKAGGYASDLTYYPSGELKKFTYGNGIIRDVALDTSQRVASIFDYSPSSSITHESLSYDLNDNLIDLTNHIDSSYNLSGFNYDGLDRLTHVSGKWGGFSQGYDEMGNILSKTVGNNTLTYHYDNTTNLLSSVSGSQNLNFEYDGKGSVINNGRFNLTFDSLNQVTRAKTTSYLYDGGGKRMKEINSAGAIKYSAYSSTGQLMHQINEATGKATDYIYIGSKLIAKVDNGLSMPTMNTPALSPDGNIVLTWGSVSSSIRYEFDEQHPNGLWENKYTGTQRSWSNSGYSNGEYQFRVRACNATECSSYKNATASVLLPPSMPASISLPTGTDSDGKFTVNWAATATATSYTIRESSNGGVSWRTVISTGGTSSSISGKSNGNYSYAVMACNSSGCSGYKKSISAVNVLLPPAIPSTITSPTGTDIDGKYTISWAAPSTATSYTLGQSVNGGGWTYSTVSSTSKAYAGKTNATYRYAVRACNASGCSAYKYSATFTVLLPPSIPATINTPIGADTDGKYTISWAAPSTATSYTLGQSVNGGGWTYSTVSSTSKAYAGKTNATYRYAVRACNASGCSAYKYSATFTVLLPPSIPATINTPIGADTDGKYTISWAARSTATSYTLGQSVNGGGWTYSTISSTSKAYAGKTNATYRYAVKACNASGCSNYKYSSTFTVILPPSSISYVSKDHDGSFTVSWASVPNATSYQLQQKLGSTWSTVYTGTQRSNARSGLANGIYTYRVKACKSGKCTYYRTGSNTIWIIRPNLTASWHASSVPNVGNDATYSWRANGADRCTTSFNNRGVTPPKNNLPATGSQTVPVFGRTTGTVTCYFGSLSKTKLRDITVDNNSIGPSF